MKSKRGRPAKMTLETLQKLEEGFLMSLSDREASLYADIAPSTLYAYCQEHSDFSERKELLKEQVKIKAKSNITKAINDGDKPLSQWYLERKAKDEFSTRTEQTGAGGKDLVPPTTDEQRNLAEAFHALLRGTDTKD